MATYIVFTREKTTDKSELEIYSQSIGSTLVGHPITTLAAYGNQVILEGSKTEGTVIVEFPSKAEALAWYNSPEYQQAAQHRFKGAIYSAVLVEGI
jgi:uncharacterized protein (DUF1330 family)